MPRAGQERYSYSRATELHAKRSATMIFALSPRAVHPLRPGEPVAVCLSGCLFGVHADRRQLSAASDVWQPWRFRKPRSPAGHAICCRGMQRGDRVGGRFEIEDRVASGGMGTIFRGRDVRSRREVAIKIVAVATSDEVGRFAREAQILAGFVDPGVVGYIAHGPDYLVMEWVEGESLRQRLDR